MAGNLDISDILGRLGIAGAGGTAGGTVRISVKQGLTDQEKGSLLFLLIYSAVITTLYLVFALQTYPGLGNDDRFEHNPFVAMLIAGGFGAFAVLVALYRIAFNIGDNDLHWAIKTLAGVSFVAGLGCWIWQIVILDSNDGTILENDYPQAYKLLLASVCISGTLLIIGILALTCALCVAICDN